MRGADPAIVLVPGVGMWSFGADAQTARVAGEFYVNAINVMHGAEALSSYTPIPDSEKFRVEYWELEERKLRLRPPRPPLTGRIAFVTGAASGIGLAISRRLYELGAAVVLADVDAAAAEREAAALADTDRVLAVPVGRRRRRLGRHRPPGDQPSLRRRRRGREQRRPRPLGAAPGDERRTTTTACTP